MVVVLVMVFVLVMAVLIVLVMAAVLMLVMVLLVVGVRDGYCALALDGHRGLARHGLGVTGVRDGLRVCARYGPHHFGRA